MMVMMMMMMMMMMLKLICCDEDTEQVLLQLTCLELVSQFTVSDYDYEVTIHVCNCG